MAAMAIGANGGVCLLWRDLNAKRLALIDKVFCGVVAAVLSGDSAN